MHKILFELILFYLINSLFDYYSNYFNFNHVNQINKKKSENILWKHAE